MSSDIWTSLELDREVDSSKIIVIKELQGCDSSFIVSCVLSNCIKNNKVVLIMSSHNCLMHYQSIGLKMNYNVQKFMDSGLIHFYDMGNKILQKVLANNQNIALEFLNDIKDTINMLHEKYTSINIIIDGISHLLDVEFSLREVNKICHEVITLIQSYNNSFLLIHCNVAVEHDSTYLLANLLSHKSQTIVEVESLTSGLSADVSGHLTIKHPGQKFMSDNLYVMKQKSAQYLFKLFDRGVKLLAPGTV